MSGDFKNNKTNQNQIILWAKKSLQYHIMPFYIYIYQLIGQVGREFANGPGDLG